MQGFMRVFLLVVAAGLVLELVSCRNASTLRERTLAVYPEHIDGDSQIRVLVRSGLSEAALTVSGGYEILSEPPDPAKPVLGAVRESSAPSVTVSVRPTEQGLKLGRNETPYAAVRIRALQGARLAVNGEDIGKEVVLRRVSMKPGSASGPFALQVVARVGIEEYLAGVIPNEMYTHWPLEALRAQCVASRTYALYKMRTRTHLDWDVYNTVASQVWKPSPQGSPIVNMAVNSTRGIVMTDNFRLFPAYFSAQCGGETKNAERVFISRHIAPLTGVRCPYCLGRPGAENWTFSLPVEEIENRLKNGGYPVGLIRNIQALDENGRILRSRGRVYDVTLEHEVEGKVRMLTLPLENVFRRLVGAGRGELASSYFSVSVRDGLATFTGRGFGHGVGLCQYGAQYLAKEGKSYQEILEYYYGGHTRVRLYGAEPR
ncbi:MAG: SpoIID/LytB domain-containing protein [Planctomycetota bacterium]